MTDEMTDAATIAEAYATALGNGDIDGVLALCAEDVTSIWPIDVFEGKAELRQALDELYTAFPDFSRDSDVTVEADDAVAMEFRASGTFEGGPFAGYDPTGKGGVLHGVDVVEVADGKITRSRIYYDQMEFAREVGVLPAEDSPGGRAMASMVNAVTKVRRALGR